MYTIKDIQQHLAINIKYNWDIICDLINDDLTNVDTELEKFIPDKGFKPKDVDRICVDLMRYVFNKDLAALENSLGKNLAENEKTNKVHELKNDFLDFYLSAETNIKESLKELLSKDVTIENDQQISTILFDNILSVNDGTKLRKIIEEHFSDVQADQSIIAKIRESLISSLRKNAKNKNYLKSSISGIFFVFVTNEENLETAILSTKYSYHPVFSVNRTYDGVIFIDENGREYKNWQTYITENVLPLGTIIAPKSGAYILDNNEMVHLEIIERSLNNTLRTTELQNKFAYNRHYLLALLTEGNENNLLCEIKKLIFNDIILVTNGKDIEDVIVALIQYIFLPKMENDFCNLLEQYFPLDDIKLKKLEMRNEFMELIFMVDNEVINRMKKLVMQCDRNENSKAELHKNLIELLNEIEDCNILQKISQILADKKVSQRSQNKLPHVALFDCIWVQNFNYKNTSCSDILMILVSKDENLSKALLSENYSVHSVCCLNGNENTKIYIDELGHIYQSWELYLSNKWLPAGVIVAPKNGEYKFNSNGNVELEVLHTYASKKYVRSHAAITNQPTIQEVQQEFAVNSGFQKEVIWDLLSKDNGNILKQKIKQLIPDKGPSDKDIDYLCIAAMKSLIFSESYILYNKVNTLLSIQDEKKNKELVEMIKKSLSVVIKKYNKYNLLRNWMEEISGTNEDDMCIMLFQVLLSKNESEVFRKCIRDVLPKPKGQQRIVEMQTAIFNSVWAQRKYTNKNSLSSIIYVLVAQMEESKNMKDVLKSKKFSCHPVIRTRKCISNNNSTNCCMIFVDEMGRVYQNWKSYIEENALPDGIMVAPKNGIYTFDRDHVELIIHPTPANSFVSNVLDAGDKISALGGLTSAAISIAALCAVPVAAPVMAFAAGSALACGAYSAVRSGYNLIDRSNHEQPIDLSDGSARNAWIGVAGGVVGVGAAGITKSVTAAAAAGQEISLANELIVNGMNITSIMISGSGVANGIIDMILKFNDNEEVSALEIVQLSASLVLFTHSVNNFRLASSIVSDTRNGTIQQYREGLSNRQRKMFNKMYKETVRIKGDTQGKMDVIRTTNEIPNKQYLNDLYKVNKNLNQKNVRPSFGGRGKGIMLNNEISVNTQELRNNIQHNKGPNVLGTVNQPIPQSHQEKISLKTGLNNLQQVSIIFKSNTTDCVDDINNSKNIKEYLKTACITLMNGAAFEFRVLCSEFFENISNGYDFQNVVTVMAENYSERTFKILMRLANEIMLHIKDEIHRVIGIFVSTEEVLYKILTHITNLSFEYIDTQAPLIKKAVINYFLSMNSIDNNNKRQTCTICGGFFIISPL